jgi:uncharacterized cupredoxin-like copper-binding protein
MIRLFVLVGIVGVSLIAYLAVFAAPPETQLPPAKSLLADFQARGVIPDPNAVVQNEEAGHGIFEVPEEDGIRLAAAVEAMASMDGMAGMEAMPGMNMDDGNAMPMEGDAMKPHADIPMQMEGDAMKPEGQAVMLMDGDAMKPEGQAAMPMDGDAMKPEGQAAMPMDDDAMKPDGEVAMQMHGEEPAGQAHGSEEEEGEGHGGGAGLNILAEGAPVDRELEIVMTEWAYSPASIEVKPGERILLKIRNGGQIPHEFMFMSMPAMTAVGYRTLRADWNLLEHEALYERSLILPGEEFQVAVEIEEPGMWMFMCMFPYHMQFGMMGGMLTEGANMDASMKM